MSVWIVLGALAFLAGSLLLVLLSGGGEGATITVDDDGGADYERIQDAIDNATAGDTIEVREGTYYENIVLDKMVNLEGAGSDETIIDRNGGGSVVTISSDSCNITGFTIANSGTGYGDGIYARNTDSLTISNVKCSNNSGVGINLIYSDHCTISYVSCTGKNTGIYVYDSESTSIMNSDFSDNGRYGIDVGKSDSCVISDTTCSNNSYGDIQLSESGNARLTNVISSRSGSRGIYLTKSNSCVITDSEVSDSGSTGIYLSQSDNCIITNSKCDLSTSSGIYLLYSESCSLNSNTMIGNGIGISGTKLEEWNTHSIPENNTVNGSSIRYLKNQNDVSISSGDGPIIIANCNGVTITGISLLNDKAGLSIGFSSYVSFADGEILYGNGVRIYYSDNCSFFDSNISFNGGEGIYARYSSYCRMTEVALLGNTGSGISIMDSSFFILHSVTLIGNGLHISGNKLENWDTHIIPANNSINGKSIRFLKDQNSVPLPAGDGPIILVNCTDILIEDQHLDDVHSGIRILFSSQIRISNTTCVDNANGIEIKHSNNCSIIDILSTNNEYHGVYVGYSEYCTIENSIVSFNGYSGIYLSDADFSTIENVDCVNNSMSGLAGHGIEVSSSDFVTIDHATCVGNTIGGIHLYHSEFNHISNLTCSLNGVGIFFYADSTTNTVTHSSIGHNKGNGIQIISDSTSNSIIGNSINDNGENGIHLSHSSEGNIIQFNDIVNNALNGISATYDESIINATYNYWGDPSGPYHPANNSGGKGGNVTDYVTFDPWFTTPVHPPSAFIDSISPAPALVSESVVFVSHGTSLNPITTYSWSSSIDGDLYTGPDPSFTFTPSSTRSSPTPPDILSLGTHTISLRVQDSAGTWSDEASSFLLVHQRPIASIYMTSESSSHNSRTITFFANATDDGEIQRYVFTSSLDGELYDGPSNETSVTNLTAGTHFINLTVQDDLGVWSDVDTWEYEVLPFIPYELPTVRITSHSNRTHVSGIVNLSGTASYRDGYVWNVSVSINQGEWQYAQGRNEWYYLIDTTTLPTGDNVIRVKSNFYLYESRVETLTINVSREIKDSNGEGGDGGLIPGFGLECLLGAIALLVLLKRR